MSTDPFQEIREAFAGRAQCRAEGCEAQPHRWMHGDREPDPWLCWEHLSPEQRASQYQQLVELNAKMERLAREPECWSWPVPEPREYATEDEARHALHEWQQYPRGCAICSVPFDLVDDHDHETGLLRGRLCHRCNVSEGMGNMSEPFVKYRERNPAVILGVKVRYWSDFTGYAKPQPDQTDADRAALRAAVDRLDPNAA